MANGYPSLEELIKAHRVGGAGEAIQSGLEGYMAGRKRRQEEDEAKAAQVIANLKQKMASENQAAGLITPEEAQTKTTQGLATPEKIKALRGFKPQTPMVRTGPNGELVQIFSDENGNTTGTMALTGPRTAQLPAGEASNLGEGNALEGLINRIEEQYNKNPSLVGSKAVVERAKLNPAIGMASAVTGIDALKSDPEASEFLRNLSSLKTLRSFSLGGKQLTPTEVEQLSKAVPSEYRPETFQQDLGRFKEEVNRILQARQKALEQSGFRNVPQAGTPPPQKRSFTVKSITKVPQK